MISRDRIQRVFEQTNMLRVRMRSSGQKVGHITGQIFMYKRDKEEVLGEEIVQK